MSTPSIDTSTQHEAASAWRLVALAKPELPLLIPAGVALGISAGIMLAVPKLIGNLVGQVLDGGDASQLDLFAGLLIVAFLVQAVFGMLRAWLFTWAGERLVTRLRSDLYKAIVGQDIGFFDASKTGELTNRLAADTTIIQSALTVNISMAMRFTALTVGGVLLIVFMSPVLAGVALSIVPVVAISGAVFGRLLRRLARRAQDALAESTAVAEESIAGIRTVRAFAQEPRELARYNGAVDRAYRLAAKMALARGTFFGLVSFSGYAAVALVTWYGGHLVLQDALGADDLIAFLGLTVLVAMSMGALAGLYADFMKAAGASRRVFGLLDQVAELEGSGHVELHDVRGHVRLEGVSFRYPTRPELLVLDHVDLSLNPGEVVALVGPSGSGKSTIAALLSRFYDPQSGRITVDGVPLTDVRPSSLRKHVGVVAQEPTLFATSIAENMRYGRPEATMDELRQAALDANALEFIDSFPDGFDTLVGERGLRLSGGQKQRIAIARALLEDPAILVLDEATSALDAESEHLVQEALDRLMRGRTTLVIAHRLSTVKDADRVVVLDGGAVIEQGTHDELVAAGGLYRRLVQRQFGGPTAAK